MNCKNTFAISPQLPDPNWELLKISIWSLNWFAIFAKGETRNDCNLSESVSQHVNWQWGTWLLVQPLFAEPREDLKKLQRMDHTRQFSFALTNTTDVFIRHLVGTLWCNGKNTQRTKQIKCHHQGTNLASY